MATKTEPPVQAAAETSAAQAEENAAPEIAAETSAPEISAAKTSKKQRGGRNLPVAIAVGLALVFMLLAVLYLQPLLFVPLVCIAVCIAALEVAAALEHANLRVPIVPLLLSSIGMVISAAVYGTGGLLVATSVSALVLVVWRVLETTGLMAVRDTMASIFTLLWVPFMACFAVLLMNQTDGNHKMLLALAAPVANDVGGYAAGVLFGRTPMAPAMSPKKTWEGFAGSLVAGVLVAALIAHFLLRDIPWWLGAIFGVIMVVVATIGDLCESLLKRDLGIKDMGALLPGHGGIMDRLDSMLLTAPTLVVLLACWKAIGG